MPKATYSRIMLHDTDAAFRQWASDLSTALKAVLTQTADTGQVDWTLGTQVKPGANTYTYYEVYRFSDSLQATRPVYIRVGYGTATSTTNPGLQITIGGATNGAGTITAPIFANGIINQNQNPIAGVAMNTYTCAKDGYWMLAWCLNPTVSNGGPHMVIVVERTRNASGVGTGNGLVWLYNVSSGGQQVVGQWSYDMGALASVQPTGLCLTPGGSAPSTSINAIAKLYPYRVFMPDEYALTGILGYLGTEFTAYTEFDIAPLPGMSAQRYMAMGNNINTVSSSQSSAWVGALRYEA